MEQLRSTQSRRRAQVELERASLSAGWEPRRLLSGADVTGQGHLRGVCGHVADGAADRQLVDQSGHCFVGGQGQHRRGRIEDFGEAAARPPADDGQRIGEPRRGDQVVGRRGEAVAAQRGRGVDEEAGDTLWPGMPEHVAVPAWRGNAGGVAGALLQPPIGPGHPGDGGLGSVRPSCRRLAQDGSVGAGRCRVRIERRHVPRPANNRRGGCTGQGAADRRAHVRLAHGLARRRRLTAAYRRHRRGNGGERRSTVAAVLDDVLPPALGIGLAGRQGEGTDRVEDGVWCPATDVVGEHPGHRHVDRGDGDATGVGPARRLPLGTEVGQRPEGGSRDIGREVAEQGHRRNQPVVGDPRQHRRNVRRQFDEDDVGADLVEGTQHRPGRPRTVVANSEEVQPLVSRARGRRRRSRSSRPDRVPPPRGTRARRSRRARDRARRRRRCRRPRRSGRVGRRRSGWPRPVRW